MYISRKLWVTKYGGSQVYVRMIFLSREAVSIKYFFFVTLSVILKKFMIILIVSILFSVINDTYATMQKQRFLVKCNIALKFKKISYSTLTILKNMLYLFQSKDFLCAFRQYTSSVQRLEKAATHPLSPSQ